MSKRPSLTHRTISGLLWTVAGKGAYGLLQLIVLAILARLITPAAFGVVSAALIVISLSAIVSQLGMGTALVQRPILEQRHIDTAFTASFLFDSTLGAIVWLTAPLAAKFFHNVGVEPVLRALAYTFPVLGLSTVAQSLMKRELRFRELANLDVASYGVGYGIVGVPLALKGYGVWALVAAQMVQTTVKTGILLWWRRPSIRMPERRAFDELMYFGTGFTVAKIANQLAAQGDYLVVGRFLGPQALGYYGRAYTLMSSPANGFGTVLDAVLFPVMAKVQTESFRLAAAFRRAIALLSLVFLPLSAAFILLAPEVVNVLLGPRWAPVVAPFQVLAAGMMFRSNAKIADALARATGAVYRRAWRQILYAALVVGGAWIGQHWGITAVAWAVLFAILVNWVTMTQLSLDDARMRWSEVFAASLPSVMVTVLAAVPGWLVISLLRHWEVPALLVIIGGSAVMLGTVAIAILRAPTRFLGAEGQWMVETMKSFVAKFRSRSKTVAVASIEQPTTTGGSVPTTDAAHPRSSIASR
ncbi:MAG TPA: lipopolysaccharide biosynthesis protein [Gemmatimonadales bacterium]|nr:lipopolysaccharide biosynthesis protein [Gemmatimonadales bacterium]